MLKCPPWADAMCALLGSLPHAAPLILAETPIVPAYMTLREETHALSIIGADPSAVGRAPGIPERLRRMCSRRHKDPCRQLADALNRAGIPCRQSKSGLRASNGSDPGKKWPCHFAIPRRAAWRAAGRLAVLAALMSGCWQANAVPSFARQTGLSCNVCHSNPPELTAFGRLFKLRGYVLTDLAANGKVGNTKDLFLSKAIPLSAMVLLSNT